MITTTYHVFAVGEDNHPMFHLGIWDDAEERIYYRRSLGDSWSSTKYTMSDFGHSMDDAAQTIGEECGEDVDAIDEVLSEEEFAEIYD